MPGREMSKEVKDLIRKFAIARVSAKPKREIHVWTTPTATFHSEARLGSSTHFERAWKVSLKTEPSSRSCAKA